MTTAQWLYTGLVAIYVVLFVLFSRMFYWRYYARKHYYNRRPVGLSEAMVANLAQEKGQEVPRISVFVPARNEADVIEKTVDHLAHLRYSPDHYEILIVTDEKEVQASDAERKQIVSNLTPFLLGESNWSGGERDEAVLLGVLSRLALEEAELAERKAGPHLSVRDLLALSPRHQREILRETAVALLSGKGKINRDQIVQTIRRCLPQTSVTQVERLYPTFLSLAIPTVMAALELKKEQDEKLAARIIAGAAQARQPLTQKVLTTLSETVSSHILRRAHGATADKLAAWLSEACAEALPTTQEIVERKRMEFAGRRNMPTLKHVVVPYDFDGEMGGVCTGQFVQSTKGRALNYSFRFADDRSVLWAFYDAESRPNRDTLLYVAWCRLVHGENFRVAQGPVYQVRNFWKMGPLCKVGGLYQSISHEWGLPYLLRTVPFIGGTNMFATAELMHEIGGFDHTVLTEDMELGARAWLKAGAWPHFVPYPSSEQTPPTFKGFYRQRLRWGSGYLQVFDKIKADTTLPPDKTKPLLRIYWWKGHFSWSAFQLTALLPLAVIALKLSGLLDASALPYLLNRVIMVLSPFYILFTLWAFFHYADHMDEASTSKRITGFAHFIVLPVSAFFLPVPYSSALVLKAMGKLPTSWVKTPRTKE